MRRKEPLFLPQGLAGRVMRVTSRNSRCRVSPLDGRCLDCFFFNPAVLTFTIQTIAPGGRQPEAGGFAQQPSLWSISRTICTWFIPASGSRVASMALRSSASILVSPRAFGKGRKKTGPSFLRERGRPRPARFPGARLESNLMVSAP